MLKVGVVGVGHLGKIHARLWKDVQGAELVGIYDEDHSRAAELATEIGTSAFTDLFGLIDMVDAVSVVTPTFAHYSVAKEALLRKKHVLIEKPITTTVREAEELIQMASEARVKIQVGHIERFNPALLTVEKYLDNPQFFESHRMAQFKSRGTDVPVVLDLMIHDIDVILSLMDSRVRSVDASGVAIISEEIDIANARIKFENGAVANVTASRISVTPMRKLRIFERRGYISIDFAAKSADVFRLVDNAADGEDSKLPLTLGDIDEAELANSIVYEKPEVKDLNPLLHELELFRDAIRNNTRPIVSGEDGLNALHVAELILASIRDKELKWNS